MIAPTRRLQRGRWRALEDPIVRDADFGLLVLEGFLTREAQVVGRSSVELLGEGDVLAPDLADTDEYAHVRQLGVWQVHAPARLAVINDDLASGFASLRRVLAQLNRRALWRSRALALRLAISDQPDLDRRLELLLWHLADRWGRRRARAVEIEAPLSGRLIATLACADPSAVSRALGRLTARGYSPVALLDASSSAASPPKRPKRRGGWARPPFSIARATLRGRERCPEHR